MYTIFESGTHGEREYDTLSWLADKHDILWLGDDIDDGIANALCSQMLAKSMVRGKGHKMKLIINSNGGDVYSAMSIAHFMENTGIEVTTICIGRAMSAAAILLLSGAKGRRFVIPSGTIMLHDIATVVGGKFEDLKIDMKETMRLRKMLMDKVVTRTKISAEEVESYVFSRDRYFTAEEALEAGIVDRIIESISDV